MSNKKDFQTQAEWLLDQCDRPDGDDRMAAFYESIYDAIVTDDEYWAKKGRDILCALAENDAMGVLVSLCGWGITNLAKRAMLMCGHAQYQATCINGTMVVEWNDGQQTASPCVVHCDDHLVSGLDYSVFVRENVPSVTIQHTFVRLDPFGSGNKYDFRCVSETERESTGDDVVFYFSANNENG